MPVIGWIYLIISVIALIGIIIVLLTKKNIYKIV